MKKLNYFLLFAFLSMGSIEIDAMKRSLHESSSNQLHDELIEKKQKQEVLIKEKIIDQLIKKLPCVLNQIILEYLGSGPQVISKIEVNNSCIRAACGFKYNEIFVGFQDGKIELWDIFTGKCVDVLTPSGNNIIEYLGISEDQNTLVAGLSRNLIKIWNLNNKENIINICDNNEYNIVTFHCFLGNNKIILSISCHSRVGTGTLYEQDLIKIYDLDKKDFISGLKGHTSHISCICPLENNGLISVSHDGIIVIWNLNNKNADFINTGQAINSVCRLDNDKLVVSGYCTISIWDLNNKQCIKIFDEDDIIFRLCMAKNNILISGLGAFSNKIIKMRNLDNGDCLGNLLISKKQGGYINHLYILEYNILVCVAEDTIIVCDLNRQFDYLNSFNNVEN